MNVRMLLNRLVFFCFIFCSCECNKKNDFSPDKKSVERVQVVKTESVNTKVYYESFGSINYFQKNALTSVCSGVLEKINFSEGDLVHKGDCVAVLRNSQLEIQYEMAKNAVKTAEASLEVLKNELRDSELYVENTFLSLSKLELSLEQKQIEQDLLENIYESKKELFELGGVTEYELNELEIEIKSGLTDIRLLEKEYEIESLGYRDEDILCYGFVVPKDEKERRKILKQINTSSVRTKLDAAEVEVQNALSSLSVYRNLVEQLKVYSPIDGVLGVKKFEVGEYVAENETIAVILDVSSLYADFCVQEKDLGKIAVGTDVEIFIPSIEKTINSIVSEISPYADSASGNFTVRAKFLNKENVIKPGMFFICKVLHNLDNPLLRIPESVFIDKKARNEVYSVIENRIVKKKIFPCVFENGFAFFNQDGEIMEGEILVDAPSEFLMEGQNVSW